MRPDPAIALQLEAVVDILRHERESIGMSKKRLADLAGVTRTAILLVERHERLPSLELALRLARGLNLSLVDVLNAAEKKIGGASLNQS